VVRRLSLLPEKINAPATLAPEAGGGGGKRAATALKALEPSKHGKTHTSTASASSRSATVSPSAGSRETYIAALAAAGITAHFVLHYLAGTRTEIYDLPLYLTLAIGGVPLLLGLTRRLLKAEFGSDLLAGISILSSVLLGQYLVGSIIILMLSGGTALEQFATRRASSVLDALAKRMPQIAHRKNDGAIADTDLQQIAVSDLLVVFPHEICPVDGAVVEGHGVMDESYLTGEP